MSGIIILPFIKNERLYSSNKKSIGAGVAEKNFE
jgi:hypothetical protein